MHRRAGGSIWREWIKLKIPEFFFYHRYRGDCWDLKLFKDVADPEARPSSRSRKVASHFQ